MKIAFALAVAFVAIVPAAAFAHSPEEQQACMDDAFNVCGHAIPDQGRVAACLAANKTRISPACRAVMARYETPGPSAQNAKTPASKPGKPLNIKPKSTAVR